LSNQVYLIDRSSSLQDARPIRISSFGLARHVSDFSGFKLASLRRVMSFEAIGA